MPPKSSNKKSAAIWFHCQTCDVHITTKSRETHEKVCPISREVGKCEDFEYIRDGILYTTSIERRTFSIDAIKDMPEKYVKNFIFISEGAIRLGNMHIGQPVELATFADNDNTTLVRTIWPIPESFLTTIFLTDTDFEQYASHLIGKSLSITALKGDQLAFAKSVRCSFENKEAPIFDDRQLEDLKIVLKYETKNLIYSKDMILHLNFFNKMLKLRILDWQCLTGKEDRTMEFALQQLSLNDRKTKRYFKVVNVTSFEIVQETRSGDAIEHEQAKKYRITKASIGGLTKQLQMIEEAMDYALGYKQLPHGVKISRCLLLYGATGCGKTMICEAMAAMVQEKSATQVIKINSSGLYSKFLGETEKNLAGYFERAYANYPQPTLLLLEDVHNLCPKYESNEIVKRVSVAFLGMLDELSSKREAQRIFLIATTTHIDALSSNIRRCGRLDSEIEIGAPTPQERIDILNCLLRDVLHDLTAASIENVGRMTHGYVGADLASLVYTATMLSLKAGDRKLQIGDINMALTQVKPSAMREVLIESPNVHWSDIGGQSELKLKLQQAIEWPLLHPDKFKRLGIKPPRGLLMFGPPGCSKTMIAKALATESQLNFLSIKGPELFSMWVGESERAVRDVFRKARQVAPAIVFFDEIDAIGGERGEGGSSGSSVKERVLTQLLTELDGVEALQNVTIVAATNRPDMIDKALLRPGRIDRIVYVGLPDDDARREILRIKLRIMPLAEDVDIETLVARTVGYTGAEIQAVCHEAALKTLEQSFDAECVTWEQFEYALSAVQPRTSPDLLRLYDDYMKRS